MREEEYFKFSICYCLEYYMQQDFFLENITDNMTHWFV